MSQRMSKKRLSAAVELLEKGLDDFVYDFRQEGFVDITTGDADIRAQIDRVSVEGVCGVYEDDDVRNAARKYRDGKAALEILARRLRGESAQPLTP